MYSIIAHDGDESYGIYEYVCSSVDDLSKLTHCAPGSTAIILVEGTPTTVYMLSPERKWAIL